MTTVLLITGLVQLACGVTLAALIVDTTRKRRALDAESRTLHGLLQSGLLVLPEPPPGGEGTWTWDSREGRGRWT